MAICNNNKIKIKKKVTDKSDKEEKLNGKRTTPYLASLAKTAGLQSSSPH